MFKYFDFECQRCGHIFDELVDGDEGKPDACIQCGSDVGFTRLVSAVTIPSTIVISYPGSKRFKAGYVHTHGDRPAEKAGSQVSMYGTGKKK